MKFLFIGFFVIFLALISSAGEVNPSQVYYGDPFNFKQAVSVNMEKVISAHPLSGKLSSYSEKEPEFWIYLNKINQDIFNALHTIAQERGYDLIVAKGSMKNIPDITREVISCLKR
ncbi:MAG: hypothetical protein GXO71_08065 [Caldiserica bacterium]|nr:hypothetical protein [Caldisericota bacterium]